MIFEFWKMHGLGNDFAVLDGLGDSAEARQVRGEADALSRTARALCDRHFGIGADGIIAVLPSETADFKMHYVNSDGSVSPMCGNGIRCAAKFVFDRGILNAESLAVETGAGVVAIELSVIGGSVAGVTVDMGAPDFRAASLPAIFPGGAETLIEGELKVDGENMTLTCLSMGNPHCVHFIDRQISVADFPVHRIGRILENMTDVFPQRVNAGFAKAHDGDRMDLRVFERGCGETMACGSGACAAVAAGIAGGRLSAGVPVAVTLPGGVLEISWSGKDADGISMFGPAVKAYEGVFDLNDYAR